MNMRTIIRNVRGMLNIRVVNVDNASEEEKPTETPGSRAEEKVIVVPLFTAPIMFIYDERTRSYRLA